MRYILLLSVALIAMTASGCAPKRENPSLSGVPKDVRIATDMDIVRGYQGRTYTVVTFQDDRCILFEGFSPKVIPIDREVKIYYSYNKIVGVEATASKDNNLREEEDDETRKGAPRLPNRLSH
jgi:hypothetical protein